MSTMPDLVLASGSQWRAQVLKDAGIPCRVRVSGVDEEAIRDPDPVVLATRRAKAKMTAVALLEPDSLVLGVDQVAHLDGEIFGKPEDEEDHFQRLVSLRGRRHELVTGVAIGSGDELRVFHEITQIVFRSDLEDEEIRAYVATGEGRGCAGGYQVEQCGAWLIDRIEGDWFNVVGLPLLRVIGVLRELGWRIPLT